MTYNYLTNEEKSHIITGKIQSIEYNKYALEIALLSEQTKGIPDAVNIMSFNEQLSDCDNQIAALQAELEALGA